MKKTSASMIWLFNDIKQDSILDFNKLLNEVIYSSCRRFIQLFNRLYPNNSFGYHELLALYDIFKDYSLGGIYNGEYTK